MDNTIIQQGNFISTGAAKTIVLRSSVDWMKVYNFSIAGAAQVAAIGVEYYWQRGLPADSKWAYFKSNAANAANLSQYIATNGFTLIDSTVTAPGPLVNSVTAVSGAAIPVVTDGAAVTVAAGDIVRMINVVDAQQIGGVDFTVGYNTLAANTFSLDYMLMLPAAGTTGNYRKIYFDPIYYPRRRTITKITRAVQAVITMSVTHGYVVGQKVRLIVPAQYGMVEMNNLLGTIVAVDLTTTTGNSITVDIDSTAFTVFAWPLSAAGSFSRAEVIPVGEDTSYALSVGADILSDSTINTGYIGMKLAGGADCPAGANTNVMYWVAGKSFNL